MDPAPVRSSGHPDVDEGLIGPLVDSVVALPHDRPEDLIRDHEHERTRGAAKPLAYWRSVEQAERHIERLAKEAVAVVVDLASVDDRA